MQRFLTIPLAATALTCAAAAEEPTTDPAPKAAVERVDEHTMRIGKITFRPKTREIRVPTEVNMTEGLLEFALVHVGGKVHESLLITEASGANLNIALKLLRYQASEELFRELEEDGSITDRYPKVPADVRAAARARIAVEWKAGGKTKTATLNEWITHAVTERPMSASPWVYGGSYVFEGNFAAEINGDLIAIFISRGALFNFPGKDNENDEVWTPAHGRVPPEGTSVTVVITPAGAQAPTKTNS